MNNLLSMEEKILEILIYTAKQDVLVKEILLREQDYKELCDDVDYERNSDFLHFRGPLGNVKVGKR